MSSPTTALISTFFFFSSRRRHTRLQGDWSSDVCSSDLLSADPDQVVLLLGRIGRQLDPAPDDVGQLHGRAARSEERRVGKEDKPRRPRPDELTNSGSSLCVDDPYDDNDDYEYAASRNEN